MYSAMNKESLTNQHDKLAHPIQMPCTRIYIVSSMFTAYYLAISRSKYNVVSNKIPSPQTRNGRNFLRQQRRHKAEFQLHSFC